jgi:hypothetical protein
MEKRGLGVVVATVLLILITVVAIGLLWVGYKTLINKSDSNSLDCTTINLKAIECNFAFGYTDLGSGEPIIEEPLIFVNFRREIGEGKLNSVRIIGKDYDEDTYVLEPQFISEDLGFETSSRTDYSGLVELTTDNAGNLGDIDEWPWSAILEANVVAVVGDTVCPVKNEPVDCKCFAWDSSNTLPSTAPTSTMSFGALQQGRTCKEIGESLGLFEI